MYTNLKNFYYQTHKEILYNFCSLPLHLNCVATLRYEIQKYKIMAEHLLPPSKLISFT